MRFSASRLHLGSTDEFVLSLCSDSVSGDFRVVAGVADVKMASHDSFGAFHMREHANSTSYVLMKLSGVGGMEANSR